MSWRSQGLINIIFRQQSNMLINDEDCHNAFMYIEYYCIKYNFI